MRKRGISPIIASLLLISFAVALGVVIMNFGRAQVELEAQCAIDVGLHLSEVSEKNLFCYDRQNQQVAFTIENGPNIRVEGLIVNVIGENKAESFTINSAKMNKAELYQGRIPYNSANSGKIRQIKIIPKVILYDEEQVCQKKALILEDISDC